MKNFNVCLLIFLSFLLSWCYEWEGEKIAVKSDIDTQWQDIDVVEDTEVAEEPESLTEIIEEVTNKPIPYTFYTLENALVNVYPIAHATTVVEWGDVTIYVDPAESLDSYEGLNAPDIILITHIHPDHLQEEIIEELYQDGVEIIAPSSVKDELGSELQQNITTLSTGNIKQVLDFSITAIPAYNIREEAFDFHPKARWDNGYVIERDNFRMYFSWDSEDTPEMRTLKNIDVAFVSMNLPFTMSVESAADAVWEFAPKTVFPYHYRWKNGFSDTKLFESILKDKNQDIEVILHDWYTE